MIEFIAANYAARGGAGQLIIFLIVFVLFVVLPAILERLVKKQQQTPSGKPEQPTPQKTVYKAGVGDVRNYLKSIGVQVDKAKPKPEPRHGQQTTAPRAHRGHVGPAVHEGAPRPVHPATATGPGAHRGHVGAAEREQVTRREEARTGRVHPTTTRTETVRASGTTDTRSEVARFLEKLGVRVEQVRPEPAPPPPPPKSKPRPKPKARREPTAERRTPEARARPEPVPQREAAPAPKAVLQPESRPALGVLGDRPTREELRRAVILGEIIRRPDFRKRPVDRRLA